ALADAADDLGSTLGAQPVHLVSVAWGCDTKGQFGSEEAGRMRIEWAVICRYVETLDTGTTMVGVGMDAVEPLPLPAEIRLNVAIALAMTYYEMQGITETLKFRVLDPNLNELASADVEFR